MVDRVVGLNPAVRSHVKYEMLDAEVVLDDGSGRLVILNYSGSLIWDYVLRGASVQEMVSGLTHVFDASSSCIEQDIRIFLNCLNDENIIEFI